MKKNRLISLFLLTAYAMLFPLHTAHAYLDPGTGSYIIQVLFGFILGAAYTIKLYWRRIIAMITGFRKPKDEE